MLVGEVISKVTLVINNTTPTLLNQAATAIGQLCVRVHSGSPSVMVSFQKPGVVPTATNFNTDNLWEYLIEPGQTAEFDIKSSVPAYALSTGGNATVTVRQDSLA